MADISFKDFGDIIGNPVNPYQQTYNDTCAIKSQQLILEEFGIHVSEDQLVQYSAEHGWYSGNGTQMSDVGKLMADAGIPCTQMQDANYYDLVDHLAHGHKVIVAVDSGELWNNGIGDWFKDMFVGDTPDHALIVAGIDRTDPNNPMVILTDPGTGQPAEPYPLDQFLDAWGDSKNFMVATDVPTPSAVESFTNSGLTDMHLPEIAGVDYSTFQDFHAYSHMIDPSQLADLNLAFQNYPTMDIPDFNMAMETYGLPYYDLSLFPPAEAFFNPMCFDYSALNNMNWIDPNFGMYTADTSAIDAQRFDTLNDLQQDAMAHAQQCLDDGMYSSAEMWQQQVTDIQHQIDNL